MAGATTAYSGRNSMVKTKEPGIANGERDQSSVGMLTSVLTGDGILGPQTEIGEDKHDGKIE